MLQNQLFFWFELQYDYFIHYTVCSVSGITGWINDERRNASLVAALPLIPLNRILIETDAPYLSPDKNIRRNEPKFLSLVVTKIASVLNVSEQVVIEQSTRNANELFGL